MAPKKSLRPKMRDDRPYLPEHEMSANRAATPIESDMAPRRSIRPRARPDNMEDIVATAREAAAVERGNRGSRYEAEDYMIGKEKYAGGGMVRGCKTSQVSGKGFKGTY
jgi:hypothetical protein